MLYIYIILEEMETNEFYSNLRNNTFWNLSNIAEIDKGKKHMPKLQDFKNYGFSEYYVEY